MTPDQIRLRVETAARLAATEHNPEGGVLVLAHLLADVLPDLVADMRKTDDAGSRYGEQNGSVLRESESSEFQMFHAGVCRRCCAEIRGGDREHFLENARRHACAPLGAVT